MIYTSIAVASMLATSHAGIISTKSAGETCRWLPVGSQCARGLTCIDSKCKPRIEEGQPCKWRSYQCAEGLTCKKSDGAYTCQQKSSWWSTPSASKQPLLDSQDDAAADERLTFISNDVPTHDDDMSTFIPKEREDEQLFPEDYQVPKILKEGARVRTEKKAKEGLFSGIDEDDASYQKFENKHSQLFSSGGLPSDRYSKPLTPEQRLRIVEKSQEELKKRVAQLQAKRQETQTNAAQKIQALYRGHEGRKVAQAKPQTDAAQKLQALIRRRQAKTFEEKLQHNLRLHALRTKKERTSAETAELRTNGIQPTYAKAHLMPKHLQAAAEIDQARKRKLAQEEEEKRNRLAQKKEAKRQQILKNLQKDSGSDDENSSPNRPQRHHRPRQARVVTVQQRKTAKDKIRSAEQKRLRESRK